MLSADDCKRILFKTGLQLGVSPKLISTRLLSADDKQDMLNGLITPEQLLVAVKVWISNDMPDYANGKSEPYREFLGRFSKGIG